MHMFNPDHLYPSWNTLPENQRNSILGRLTKPAPLPEVEKPAREGPIDRYMTRSHARKLRMSRRKLEGMSMINKLEPSLDTAQLDEMQVEDCPGRGKTEITANTPQLETARLEDLSAKVETPEWQRTAVFGQHDGQQMNSGDHVKTRSQRRRHLAGEKAKGAGIPKFSGFKHDIRRRISRKKRRLLDVQRLNSQKYTLTDKAKLEAISKGETLFLLAPSSRSCPIRHSVK